MLRPTRTKRRPASRQKKTATGARKNEGPCWTLRWKDGQREAFWLRVNWSRVSRTWIHIRYITTTRNRHTPNRHTGNSAGHSASDRYTYIITRLYRRIKNVVGAKMPDDICSLNISTHFTRLLLQPFSVDVFLLNTVLFVLFCQRVIYYAFVLTPWDTCKTAGQVFTSQWHSRSCFTACFDCSK